MNNQERPLVTIVTLSYKKYEYIYECINSVLKQDYPNIQYIISDDGATNCPKYQICKFVKDNATSNIKDFVFLANKHNLGTVKNLNRAVDKANGKFIIHLSADDVFYAYDTVSRIVELFLYKKCEVLGTLRLRCDKNLQPICYMPAKFYQRRIRKFKTAKQQYEAFISGRSFDMASGAVLSYTREYWEKHPFDESYILWEDGPFIERYLRDGNFLNLDYSIPTIYYREGGISTSGEVNPMMIQDMNLYTKRNYITISSSQNANWLLVKLLENYYVSSVGKWDITSRIKRYMRYFYLLPIKVYYRLEQRIVYCVETWLMQNGFMK